MDDVRHQMVEIGRPGPKPVHTYGCPVEDCQRRVRITTDGSDVPFRVLRQGDFNALHSGGNIGFDVDIQQ